MLLSYFSRHRGTDCAMKEKRRGEGVQSISSEMLLSTFGDQEEWPNFCFPSEMGRRCIWGTLQVPNVLHNIYSEHEFQLFGSITSRNSWKLTLKASDRIMQHPKALSGISSGHISQTVVLWISVSDLPALALFLRVIEIITSQKLHNIRRIFKCMFTSCPQ